MWKSRPTVHRQRPSVVGVSPVKSRPLVITSDPDLLDDLLRLAAAADVEVEVAAHPRSAVRSWHRAPLVIVGDDALDQSIATRLPRREQVLIACAGGHEPDEALWRRAVDVGAEHVVGLPVGDLWLTGRLADSREGALSEGRLITLIGARGGAGASTLAVCTALRSARSGTPTLLVDFDHDGGGLDLALAIDHMPGARWPDLARTAGRMSPLALAEALPRCESLAVLSWDRGPDIDLSADAVNSALTAALRGFAMVVADAPRQLDDVTREAIRRSALIVLVVPREVRAVAAAQRQVENLQSLGPAIAVITRGLKSSGPDPLDVCETLGLPHLGDMRTDGRLASATERGDPIPERGVVMRVADAVLAAA